MIQVVERPFPLAALVKRLGDRPARKLGINGSVWKEMTERGSLTVREADRLAVRAGFHPFDVWGDLWFSLAMAESEAAT